MHLTKRPILKAKTAILCEGQIDLIACYEAGISKRPSRLLAPVSLRCTEKSLSATWTKSYYSMTPTLQSYKSSLRTFTALAHAGILVRAGEMPAGEDPDSFLKKEGPEALQHLIDEAKEFHDFQIDHRSAEMDMSTVRSRVQLAREVAHTGGTIL